MWDNSPRKGRDAFIMTGSTPALYKKLLKGMLDSFEPYSPEENLFFINAWNEWAEGNHLEPDQLWGPLREGGLAEWLMAAVLKTVDLNGFGGSNPSPSAKESP